jgi:hypothetical protein
MMLSTPPVKLLFSLVFFQGDKSVPVLFLVRSCFVHGMQHEMRTEGEHPHVYTKVWDMHRRIISGHVFENIAFLTITATVK